MIDTRLAILHKGRRLAQAAVFKQRKRSNAIADVICNQCVSSRLVQQHVDRIRTTGRDLVQESEPACGPIYSECGHSTRVVVCCLIHCIKEPAARMNSQERWIHDFDQAE